MDLSLVQLIIDLTDSSSLLLHSSFFLLVYSSFPYPSSLLLPLLLTLFSLPSPYPLLTLSSSPLLLPLLSSSLLSLFSRYSFISPFLSSPSSLCLPHSGNLNLNDIDNIELLSIARGSRSNDRKICAWPFALLKMNHVIELFDLYVV